MGNVFKSGLKAPTGPALSPMVWLSAPFSTVAQSLHGPLYMFSAAVLFTLSNISIKLISPEFSAWHIAFYRFFGGLIFLLLLFRPRERLFSGHNRRLLIIRGALGAVAFICYTTSIRMLPVSTALVIVYTFPAFAAVFAYIIYHERLGVAHCLCIGMAILGIAILLDFQSSDNYLGQIVALISSALAGLAVTLVRELRKNNGAGIIYLYVCAIGVVVTLPKFLQHPVFPQTSMESVMIMAIIFFSGAGQLLMNQGFYYCRSWEGGVMMSSEAVFTIAAGIFFLGDIVAWRFFVGGLLVFSSSVILTRIKGCGNK